MTSADTGLAAYDLHLHTCWSYDAVAPVEYYFRRARELRTRRIAIAEHFTMDSLPEILDVSARYPEVRYIPATELTVQTSLGLAVDLVCLGLPAQPSAELEKVFEKYREWQRQCGAALSAGMLALGHDFGDERRLELLKTYRPPRTIERQGVTHVQGSVVLKRHFIERGFAANEQEYKVLLRKANDAASRPRYPSADEALPAVRRAGGLVFIAHPVSYFNRDDRRRMDALREELQFDGVECAHDGVPPELTPVYRAYCRERGLLSSAGSDCHADPACNPYGIGAHHDFARHRGEEAWLDELLERLRQ